MASGVRSKDKPSGHSKSPPVNHGAIATPRGSATPPPADQQAMLTLSIFENGIQELKNTLCGKLDKLSAEVSAISDKVNHLEASIDINSDKIKALEETELPKLHEDIKRLKDKLTMNEIYHRKLNLLFYGIPERQQEAVADVLRQTFANEFQIEENRIAQIMIVNAHRLPRRSSDSVPAGANRPSPTPIIAKFVLLEDRNLVLNAYERKQRQRTQEARNSAADGAAAPPGRWLSVRTDLPPLLKARRNVLATQAYKFRREQGLATRIIVIGAEVLLQTKEKGTTKWNTYVD